MTMIKLENGDYINTEAVEIIRGGDNPYIGLRSNNSFDITPADRDRIVEAMGSLTPADADYDIHTDSDGNQYQLLTGRELIAGLADDAMQDEVLKDSYAFVGDIVPSRKYKAYLNDNAGALSGEWEEV